MESGRTQPDSGCRGLRRAAGQPHERAKTTSGFTDFCLTLNVPPSQALV